MRSFELEDEQFKTDARGNSCLKSQIVNIASLGTLLLKLVREAEAKKLSHWLGATLQYVTENTVVKACTVVPTCYLYIMLVYFFFSTTIFYSLSFHIMFM